VSIGLAKWTIRIWGEWDKSKGLCRCSSRLRLPLADVVTPLSQGFDYLWEDGCGERYPNEDEGFVNDVREAELSPDGCMICQPESYGVECTGVLQASAPLRAAISAAPTFPSLAVASARSSAAAAAEEVLPASGKASRTTLQKAFLSTSS
jgi:hypothetical protein